MKKNYTVAKSSKNGDIELINYSKLDGFIVKPKNEITYPGIEVNSMMIIKPSFIEKMIKRKNQIKLDYYLNYIIDQSEDSSPDSTRKALDNIARYKGIIEYKYRKYLDDKYIDLLNKKLDLIERKLKTRQIYYKLNYQEEIKEKSGKSR